MDQYEHEDHPDKHQAKGKKIKAAPINVIDPGSDEYAEYKRRARDYHKVVAPIDGEDTACRQLRTKLNYREWNQAVRWFDVVDDGCG